MAGQAAIDLNGFAVVAPGDAQGCWRNWLPGEWIVNSVQSHQAQGPLHLLRPLLMGGLDEGLETGEIAELELLEMGCLSRQGRWHCRWGNRHWFKAEVRLNVSPNSDFVSEAITDSPNTALQTGVMPEREAEITQLQSQLEESRDEAELNLLMLQQVQEELEFYFLAHQQQEQLLMGYRQEQTRAEALIQALLERLDQARA